MAKPSILLIEDDPVLGPALQQRLDLDGFDVTLAANGAVASAHMQKVVPSAVVSDIRLPDCSGEDLYQTMLNRIGPRPTMFMTAFGDLPQAIRLVKAGALDYLTKPIDVDALCERLHQACKSTPTTIAPQGHLGVSAKMRALDAVIAKAARAQSPVLIRGETGVGKEVAARRLHELSTRSGSPFLALNCAAIPRELFESTLFGHEKGAFTGAHSRAVGYFERARQGTLLLDEIGETPLEHQVKLLRVLQDKGFTPVGSAKEHQCLARLVFATNRDLLAEAQSGRFREDLYYRIAVVEIVIPPLRERPEDAPWLAHRLLGEIQNEGGDQVKVFDPETLDVIRDHAWPGNVRELRNRIERAVILSEGPIITPADVFPETVLEDIEDTSGGYDGAVRTAIRQKVEEALRVTGGVKSEAAKRLGISRTTLWKRMKEFGMLEG